jgi:hexosaminidase
VVPEIEMPGHSEAALAAYPEYSCDPKQTYQVAQTWGVFYDIYCPTDQTFSFLEDVLTEVMDLFPSKYIHIGGDEAPKDAWKKSAFCQKLMKEQNLQSEDALQSYFIQRIEKFVNSKGRSIIGWDEILEGGLSPNATVMSWRGEEGGIAAAQQNHNVIMTPGSGGLYIDQQQSKQNQEPLSIGGFDPLNKIYSYDPTPDILTPDQQKFIVGVQANLWTEYIPTDNHAEYMIWPRVIALAEVAWSPLARKNYNDFANTRLPAHLAKLDATGIDYRVPEVIGLSDTTVFGAQLNVKLKPSVAGAKVYYTIDNYDPRETDIEYMNPMTYPVPQDQYRDLKAIVITPSGKRSVVTHERMYNIAPLHGISFGGMNRGMKYQLITGDFSSVDQLAKAPVIDSGATQTWNTAAFKKNNKGFGVIYTGYLRIDADGDYGFSLISANGSELVVDDQIVINNDGRHGTFEQGGSVGLLKGFHKVVIKYFDNGNTGVVRMLISIPGKPKGELTAGDLFIY